MEELDYPNDAGRPLPGSLDVSWTRDGQTKSGQEGQPWSLGGRQVWSSWSGGRVDAARHPGSFPRLAKDKVREAVREEQTGIGADLVQCRERDREKQGGRHRLHRK